MYKEFLSYHNQNGPGQDTIGINMMGILSYFYQSNVNRMSIYDERNNWNVWMPKEEFEAFKLDLKRAMRLKASYE